MNNILTQLEQLKKKCTGCGACYNICPVKAIEKEYDAQGFFYPEISVDKCIKCNKCLQVCPKINPYTKNNIKPKCYAAMANDDVRLESSSGGMFTLLANLILETNGVVCGVEMSSDYSVKHICVYNKSQLYKLQKSKYVQSNTGMIYNEVKKLLDEGKKVLFSGCPCQVAAARNYFGDNDQLILVDILCHGVPSEKMWKDYISENFNTKKLVNIEFRSKLNGWRAEQLRAFYSNGTSEAIPWPESAYEEGFQRNISLRDGCEDCEFAGFQRQGDITLGDFWHIEDFDLDMNDKKGTSVILINNKKGEDLFDAIKSKLLKYKEFDIKDAAKFNRLYKKYPAHPMKERFKKLYPYTHNFTKSIMQCRHSLYDIGLVGIYCVKNFGGHLTQYALYKTLTDLGYSVLMIECPKDSKNPPSPRGPYLFLQNPYPDYSRSKFFNNIAEMKFLNLQCDTFITGSDQMFNNNLYNNHGKFMSLNFVTDNHKKIAYAASWGHDKIWGEESDRGEEAYFLKKFDYFSVREDSAVDLAKKEFGVEATWVLDPVFLCPLDEYKKMARIGEAETPNEDFLFAYILDPTKEKETILTRYAKNNGLKIKAVLDEDPENRISNIQEFWSIDTLSNTKIEIWISHFAKSKFVITDSFHGTCLAILFHKNFLVLVNKRRGEARFTSLLNLLGLSNRMCYSFKEVEEKLNKSLDVDYSKVDKILNLERFRCIEWLKKAIDTEFVVKKSFSEFDILDGRIDYIVKKYDRELNELEKKIKQSTISNLNKDDLPWILRKLNGGWRCYKDNGIVYTIKRSIFKIMQRIDK